MTLLEGHVEAAGRAALCFAKGRGVGQSWERAVHWWGPVSSSLSAHSVPVLLLLLLLVLLLHIHVGPSLTVHSTTLLLVCRETLNPDPSTLYPIP